MYVCVCIYICICVCVCVCVCRCVWGRKRRTRRSTCAWIPRASTSIFTNSTRRSCYVVNY